MGKEKTLPMQAELINFTKLLQKSRMVKIEKMLIFPESHICYISIWIDKKPTMITSSCENIVSYQ